MYGILEIIGKELILKCPCVPMEELQEATLAH
jgi:hypothetical protein